MLPVAVNVPAGCAIANGPSLRCPRDRLRARHVAQADVPASPPRCLSSAPLVDRLGGLLLKLRSAIIARRDDHLGVRNQVAQIPAGNDQLNVRQLSQLPAIPGVVGLAEGLIALRIASSGGGPSDRL